MSTLTLTVLRGPDGGSIEQRRVQGGELTLGRGAECGWCLHDPLKFLSKVHCALEFNAGTWQVRDLSMNGTFLNAAAAPIGRDRAQPLRDGDRLRLGNYEIEIRVEEVVQTPHVAFGQQAAPSPFGEVAFGQQAAPSPSGEVPFGQQAPPSPFVEVAFGQQRAPSPFGEVARSGFAATPLPGLDNFFDDPAGDAGSVRTEPVTPDHGASSSDAFVPPSVASVGKQIVPDDWYNEEIAPVASSAEPDFEPMPPVVTPVVPVAPVSRPSLVAAGDMQAALALLMSGGNLPPETVARFADPEATLRNAGALLLAAVAGIRALLIARGAVKREFRIEQTMLKPADNNPLKFAASDEQALEALLDPRKNPMQAMQESISDLSVHQVAALAATQAAARALLERLGPRELEAADRGGRGLFSDSLEKRLWEAYKRRHAQLVEQFEDDFESAFGTTFARAYEQAAGGAKG